MARWPHPGHSRHKRRTDEQKRDARLDRLLKVPDRKSLCLVAQDKNMTWKLLAIRAGYIRLGLIRKLLTKPGPDQQMSSFPKW